MEKNSTPSPKDLKISICIPQYNRIDFLKIALKEIEQQDYSNLEICISDDASTDSTYDEIMSLKETYNFPLVYHRFNENQGYDRNLRKSMEIASGDYCFILGNDDSLNGPNAMSKLAQFLLNNQFPDVGFCNSADYLNRHETQMRAHESAVIGTGAAVAMKYYSSFSFVAGLIFKKTAFEKYNTDAYDKSIYVQIYIATAIMSMGEYLFTFKDPLVLKDIRYNHEIANSYRDTLPRKWKNYKSLDAGLPSYSRVAFKGITQQNTEQQPKVAYNILKRIYVFTYPFWLIDYRDNNAFVASYGLYKGLKPTVFDYYQILNFIGKCKVWTLYLSASLLGLFTPIFVFKKLRPILYSFSKK